MRVTSVLTSGDAAEDADGELPDLRQLIERRHRARRAGRMLLAEGARIGQRGGMLRLACGPGSSKPIRQHADEVSSSQTAPSSASAVPG